MTTSPPRVIVVEIDGVHWRHQKYRCRRNTRAFAMMVRLLGASTLRLISSAAFANTSEEKQIAAFRGMFLTAEHTGGHATDPDEFEAAADELFAFSPAFGGEGLSYSNEPIGEYDAGWTPVRGLVTLSSIDGLDWATAIAVLWEIVKVEFRPTSAGAGTSAGMGQTTSTSTDAPTPRSASDSLTGNTPTSGNPPPQTPQVTGITGV